MDIASILSWACQVFLAFLFFRSAWRKVNGFVRVAAEFEGWGYPFPRQITFFLINVWILCGTALFIPGLAGFAAAVLLAFMIVAFATLVVHHEYRRLVEPGRPIVLSLIIIAVHHAQMLKVIETFLS